MTILNLTNPINGWKSLLTKLVILKIILKNNYYAWANYYIEKIEHLFWHLGTKLGWIRSTNLFCSNLNQLMKYFYSTVFKSIWNFSTLFVFSGLYILTYSFWFMLFCFVLWFHHFYEVFQFVQTNTKHPDLPMLT